MATSIPYNALETVLTKFAIPNLKTEQKKILECLIDGRDCMAVLPTGYGKSLPFQMFIPLKREIDHHFDKKLLVCSPLVSLMQDQVEKLTNIDDITAAYKGASAASDQRIRDGEIDIIYASPEALIGDPEWRSAIQKLNISSIVVDEFHTIATWGEDTDDSGKKAFRKWFSYIGELRSLFPDANILALSATCTLKIRKRVKKVLKLKADTVEISVSPNKPNIKFVISKVHTCIEIAMCWLVDGLNTKQKAFPRTIIYCRTIKDTACLFQYITTEIPECVEFVDMYHSLAPSVQKDKIMEGLRSPTGTLRLVIATSALGMGIDIVSFYSVVVFGLSDTLVDLLQEIGRVGRDGKPSAALLLYNSYHLRSVGREVKEITMCTGCRREAIMSSFLNPEDMEKLKETTRVHSCCDACATHCACGVCTSLPIEDMFHSIDGCEDANDSADSDVTVDYQCISDFDDSFDIDL